MFNLLTIPQTAKAINCSAPTVRRMIATGELPAVTIGRRRRVSTKTLDQWIENGGSKPINDASSAPGAER